MGTYLRYHLADPSEERSQEVNNFMDAAQPQPPAFLCHVATRADVEWETQRHGYTAQKLGHGYTKISGYSGKDREAHVASLVLTLTQAVAQFGLVVEHLPPNANDYLTQEQCDALEDPATRVFMDRLLAEDEEAWTRAKRDALRSLQRTDTGGVLTLPRAGGGWLDVLFAKVDAPRLRQFYYTRNGFASFARGDISREVEVRSATFESATGVQTLLSPLLACSPDGLQKLVAAFTEIPFACYSAAPLQSLLAGAYKIYPAAQRVPVLVVRALEAAYRKSMAWENLSRQPEKADVWLHVVSSARADDATNYDYSTDTWKSERADWAARYGPMANVYITNNVDDALRTLPPLAVLTPQGVAALLWKLEQATQAHDQTPSKERTRKARNAVR